MARKIQHKRGLKQNLPQLDNAELGFTTDTKEIYIGSEEGNQKVAMYEDVESAVEDVHTHNNKEVLDGLTDDGNGLRYEGKEIGGVVDLSDYARKEELDEQIGSEELLTKSKNIKGAINELYNVKQNKPAIYGVEVDKENSNPETRVTYIGDAEGFTPMRGNDGSFEWGSWKGIFESFNIRPCVLKNGQVAYYLDPDDYTKKADGSSADLSGADGDVMVEFGKVLWYKWTDKGTKYTIELSDKEFDGAAKHAFEVEDGYNQANYYPLLLTQILYLIFFKSTDSQGALGRGYVGRTSSSPFLETGLTNRVGMFYGSEDSEQMKFLGLEDYWGNKHWWIDGIYADENYDVMIGKNDFNDTGAGYDLHETENTANLGAYFSEVQGGNDMGFIPKKRGGSSTTYYADYGALYSSRVVRFGGDRSRVLGAGAFSLRLHDSRSVSRANIGARLFCKSNDKIYIGAYLGTTVGGKLRSISGQEPTGSKTIRAFRIEARANN